MKGNGKLTPKMKMFCKEYIIDFNGSRAARATFPHNTHPRQKAFHLLTKDYIQAEIQEEVKKRENRTEITQDRVLKEYARLAFLDPQKFYDDEGNLLPVTELPKDVAAALTGMDVSTRFNKESLRFDTLKKIKFADKKGALDSVAKHLGMLNDKLTIGIDDKTLMLITGVLPERYAIAVKAALLLIAKDTKLLK